jgi:hypothetical protein
MRFLDGMWKGMLGGFSALLISGMPLANAADSLIDTRAIEAAPSVTPLGVRIVPGAGKNDFYILGKTDARPVEVVVTKHSRVVAAKNIAPRAKVAAKRAHVFAHRKDISTIKLALHQPAHQVRSKKIASQLRTAFNKNSDRSLNKNKHIGA